MAEPFFSKNVSEVILMVRTQLVSVWSLDESTRPAIVTKVMLACCLASRCSFATVPAPK